MLRAERSIDSTVVSALLARSVSIGQPSSDWDTERLTAMIKRLSRWDVRLALGIASAMGRPVYRTFVEEVNERIRGAMVWAPGRAAGWVAAIGLDPGAPDPVVLGALLERCWEETRRQGLAALLVPGSILPHPSEAPSAMPAMGFLSVGSHRRWQIGVDESTASISQGPSVRTFRRRDGIPIAEFIRAGRPPELEAIEPLAASDLSVSSTLARALGSHTEAFVHDGPRGPDAFVRVTRSSASRTAHLSVAVAPDAPNAAGRSVLSRSLGWSREHGAVRAMAETRDSPLPAAELLRDAGFAEQDRWETWARTIDGRG